MTAFGPPRRWTVSDIPRSPVPDAPPFEREPDMADQDVEVFVRAHQTGVWRYLRLLGAESADAEDLLQETFLRFFRTSTPEPENLPLLRRIARGLWVDRQRWLKRRRTIVWADHVDSALAEQAFAGRAFAGSGDALEGPWLDALAACRERLPARSRRAVELCYRDGLDRSAIGRELGLADNTVRNVLAKARVSLRGCIEQRLTETNDE